MPVGDRKSWNSGTSGTGLEPREPEILELWNFWNWPGTTGTRKPGTLELLEPPGTTRIPVFWNSGTSGTGLEPREPKTWNSGTSGTGLEPRDPGILELWNFWNRPETTRIPVFWNSGTPGTSLEPQEPRYSGTLELLELAWNHANPRTLELLELAWNHGNSGFQRATGACPQCPGHADGGSRP